MNELTFRKATCGDTSAMLALLRSLSGEGDTLRSKVESIVSSSTASDPVQSVAPWPMTAAIYSVRTAMAPICRVEVRILQAPPSWLPNSVGGKASAATS